MKMRIVVSEGAKAPVYATAGSAGADLCCLEPFELAPLERRLVPTGIRMEVPPGYEVQIRPRSGLALKKGISMVNTPGTIDSDFRGEIGVILINLGSEIVVFESGERIAQMVLCPVLQAQFEVVSSLDASERGEGGFGSTGSVVIHER